MRNTSRLSIVILSFLWASTTIYSQRTEIELQFKDGKVLNGLGKLKRTDVKFRLDSKEKAQFFSFKELERIKIKEGANWEEYRSINVEGLENPIMLQLIVEGEVNLYQQSSFGYMPTGPAGVGSAGGTSFGGGQFYTADYYYLKKKSQSKAVHLGSSQLFSKNFKKAASEYFEDCARLVEKIQTAEYKKKQIKEISTFYNTECN
ncbi:hypothetical protein [Flagellimonas sp. 2504JD4-2]